MRNAAWLVGVVTSITACSFDHIVVATLDDASAGAANRAMAGSSSVASFGGSGGAGGAPNARAAGEAGRVALASGGVVDTPVIDAGIGEGGGGSVTRCSCIGRTSQTSQVCGTDGITYPTECPDAGACVPPGIACLEACPCPDGGVESAGTNTSTWFLPECISTAHCSEGVMCTTFHNVTLVDDTPTACVGSN